MGQGKAWGKRDLGQIQAGSTKLLLSTAARQAWHGQGEEIPASSILSSWWSDWKCLASGDFGAWEVTRGHDASRTPPSLAGKPHLRAAWPAGGKPSYGLSLCSRPFPLVPKMLEAGCACPESCGGLFLQPDTTLGPAGMGKDACLSGKHLKEGKEEKTGISLELQQ